jgi:peptidoglycan/xylan/chitin deacetylase (PgdA/CDA1 family)
LATTKKKIRPMIAALVLAVVGLIALSHVAPFPFILDAAGGGVAMWEGPPERSGGKVVYLTFDDGPNPTATPTLLDVLREKKVSATFFLIPKYVHEETAPILRRMFEEGHAVALHSADRWLILKSPEDLAQVIDDAADKVERFGGHRPCPLFRPHGGWRSHSMMRGLRRSRYRLVGWSWMMWDWNWGRQRTASSVASRVLARAKPGRIIVIHDGHHKDPAADRRYAVEAAGLVVDGLRARGYELAPLCGDSEERREERLGVAR